jgi:3-dehydroquinate synthase
LINQIGALLPEAVSFKGPLLIITDSHIRSLHGDALCKSLADHACLYHFIEVVQGEDAKTLDVARQVIDKILDVGGQRRSLIIAFGGGAVTDLAGFVASIYMRGINYINIPTTLTAQIDAAIGGKTSVDHPAAKNLIGAFFQPRSVYCDPQVLRTLSKREINNGIAEAVKVAMISSSEFFQFIETNLNNILDQDISSLTTLVLISTRIKAQLLEKDPYETDLRRPLNFGHSIAHAVEALKGFSGIKHGEAVAIGMACATRIALRRQLCSSYTANRLLDLLERIGLPTYLNDISPDTIARFLEPIRLIRGGSLNFVIPTDIGKVIIMDDISNEEIAWAITAQ